MNIVLIDDDKNYLESLKSALTISLKYQVRDFHDTEMALEYLETNSFEVDVVLIDEAMPSISGRELGKRISQLDYSRTLPMIMLTGLKEIQYAIEALTVCGFDYFIWKADFAPKDKKIEFFSYIESLPSIKIKRSYKQSLLKEKMTWDGYKFSLSDEYRIGETAQMMLRLLYINQMYEASNGKVTNEQLNYGYDDYIKSIEQKFSINIGELFAGKLNKNEKDENAAIWLPKIEDYLDGHEFDFNDWEQIEKRIVRDESKKSKPNSITKYFNAITKEKAPDHKTKRRQLLKLLIEDKKNKLKLVKEHFTTINDVVKCLEEQIQIF